MTDANVSPVTDVDIVDATIVTATATALPLDDPAAPRMSWRGDRAGDGRLLSLAWPVGIALATVGIAWLWARSGPPSVKPSMVGRAIKALTPRASEQQRGDARRAAQELASPGDWLFAALDHHRDIEGAFG